MLTADLVRARRRGDRLHLTPLQGEALDQARVLARHYLRIARGAVGLTRAEVEEAFQAVPFEGRQRKLALGLLKLVRDRCTFEAEQGPEPRALRREVFLRAAAARRRATAAAPFDREAVLAQVAREQGLTPAALERGLYADLRDAHRLLAFADLRAEALVEEYQLAQAQAVLLRAVRLTAQVYGSPAELRHLFARLKFHRLLFEIQPPAADGGHRLVIDGPYSLFSSVTRYGLQLALVLPALRACERWSVEAQVVWGGERRPLTVQLSGARGAAAGPAAAAPGTAALPPEVQALLERFQAEQRPWSAAPCAEVLHLPGVGLCVPDLVFQRRADGARVLLEVLGFWSREAVWRRVELVQAGLPTPVLFACSARLRVSEQVLGEDLPGALYVYKGVMSAAAVQARLERLAGARPRR